MEVKAIPERLEVVAIVELTGSMERSMPRRTKKEVVMRISSGVSRGSTIGTVQRKRKDSE